MRIRHARSHDLAALLELETRAFDPRRRASVRSLRRSLASAHQRVLVAEEGGAVAAFAVVWLHRRTWRIYDLAVDPDRQGRGLGRALMARVEADARQADVARLVLEADAKDTRLGSFYVRRGYRATARRQGYYGPRRDAIRYEKAL
jgi:ribosomal protein S18 acetylase RimI-like enzyme